MRVAIYARVSTEAQESRGTIGSQLEALRHAVAAAGHELIAEFVDDGYSGARLDRPGLDALRDGAEAGAFMELWCLTPDRLSRSYAYQVLITDELARHGVGVVYLDTPALATDPQARLLTQIQSVIAEYVRAKISERSRRGKLFRARAGEAVHWRAPFGYVRVPRQGDRPAHLVVNESQAAVVRRIFADYTTGGLSLRQIALALNREGVPTAGGRRWLSGTVSRMLQRSAYVGRAVVNTTKSVNDRPGMRPRQVARPPEEWITIPCPPIVEEATFRGRGPGLRGQYQLRLPAPRPERGGLAAAGPGVLRLRHPLDREPRPVPAPGWAPLLRLSGPSGHRRARPSQLPGRQRGGRRPRRVRLRPAPGGLVLPGHAARRGAGGHRPAPHSR